MQSIGERLEEARKRKGISLREAAEATKIRSDFLGHIESDQFDFDLPEIYKRGFLKNYARYLKLDADKMIADYNAQLLSSSRLGSKNGAEWFGQMEIKKTEEDDSLEAHKTTEAPSYGRISPKQNKVSQTPLDEPSDRESDQGDPTFYWKIGLIFVGTLALIFVIFGLIWSILGGGRDETAGASLEQPEIRADLVNTSRGEIERSPERANIEQITLIASGNVYVLVRQRTDNRELYKNTMSAGESVTLKKQGAVDVLFTAGENLIIEQGDERFRPSSNGTAKITLQ